MLSRLSCVLFLVMNSKTNRCPMRKADNRLFRLMNLDFFSIFTPAYSPG